MPAEAAWPIPVPSVSFEPLYVQSNIPAGTAMPWLESRQDWDCSTEPVLPTRRSGDNRAWDLGADTSRETDVYTSDGSTRGPVLKVRVSSSGTSDIVFGALARGLS